jgi:hypothetical protein
MRRRDNRRRTADRLSNPGSVHNALTGSDYSATDEKPPVAAKPAGYDLAGDASHLG